MNTVNKINSELEEEYLCLIKGMGKLINTIFFIQGLEVVVMLVVVVVVLVEVVIVVVVVVVVVVVDVVANISVDCLHARDGVHPSTNNTIYSHVHDTLLYRCDVCHL